MSEFQTQVETAAKDLKAAIWVGVPNPESGAWVLWPGADFGSFVKFAG